MDYDVLTVWLGESIYAERVGAAPGGGVRGVVEECGNSRGAKHTTNATWRSITRTPRGIDDAQWARAVG